MTNNEQIRDMEDAFPAAAEDFKTAYCEGDCHGDGDDDDDKKGGDKLMQTE